MKFDVEKIMKQFAAVVNKNSLCFYVCPCQNGWCKQMKPIYLWVKFYKKEFEQNTKKEASNGK